MPDKQKRRWIIPDEVLYGDMNIREFLQKAKYDIKNGEGCEILKNEFRLGKIMIDDSVVISSGNLENTNAINYALDLIELLHINHIEYNETDKREEMIKAVKETSQNLIKRMEEVPKGKII